MKIAFTILHASWRQFANKIVSRRVVGKSLKQPFPCTSLKLRFTHVFSSTSTMVKKCYVTTTLGIFGNQVETNPFLAVDMEGRQCGCQCSCSCSAAYSPCLNVGFAELNLPSALDLHAMSHTFSCYSRDAYTFEVRISASKHVSAVSRHVQVSSISVYHWKIWKITIVSATKLSTTNCFPRVSSSHLAESTILPLDSVDSVSPVPSCRLISSGTWHRYEKHLPITATH